MPEFDSTLEYRTLQQFPGYLIGSDGSVWSNKKGTWRRLRIRKRSRYLQATLYGEKNRSTTISLHRLVLMAFIGAQPSGHGGRHLDGNPGNNSAKNLLWGTQKENKDDELAHGRRIRGTKHKLNKLSESEVLRIRSMYKPGVNGYRAMGRIFGVSRSTVRNIIKKISWEWLMEA